jgi:hypothetical protein
VTDLPIWVVYDHPSDLPDHYVARLWRGAQTTSVAIIDTDLERLRETLERMGLVHLDRMEGDDPAILETWL